MPTVYVVDDDEAVRESLTALLNLWGMENQAFSSACAFLEADPTTMQGCVLVDLSMPGMGGLALIEELRERCVDLPVLLMTGHKQSPVVRQSVESWDIEVLEKPYRVASLLRFLQANLS